MNRVSKPGLLFSILLFWLLAAASSPAETCYAAGDMDAATRSAIEASARQLFDYAAHGDAYNLKQAAIPGLAANFSGIEDVVIDQKPAYAGAQAQIRQTYLLDASSNPAPKRVEFFCGVWATPDFASFAINDLPPGKYGLVIQNVTGPKGAYGLALILKQEQGGWKLAGYYSKPQEIGGHDADWYLAQARAFKSKGENHDAWFYYLTAWDLMAPVDFMSTQKRDKVSDEMQTVRPADLPGGNSSVDLVAGAHTFKVTRIFADRGDNGLVLVVKYQVPDVSNTQQTFENNMAVIQAIVKKYPEYREAFSGVVARAVEPSGREYASLLPMKDVK